MHAFSSQHKVLPLNKQKRNTRTIETPPYEYVNVALGDMAHQNGNSAPLGRSWATLGALVGLRRALVGRPFGMNPEHNASRFSGEPETLNATHKTD